MSVTSHLYLVPAEFCVVPDIVEAVYVSPAPGTQVKSYTTIKVTCRSGTRSGGVDHFSFSCHTRSFDALGKPSCSGIRELSKCNITNLILL